MKNYYAHTIIYIFILMLTIHSKVLASTSPKMVIYNVTLISPERTAPVKNSYVIIEDGKIINVGKGTPKPLS